MKADWQVNFFRKNIATRLLWAAFVGIVFRYAVWLTKIVLWSWNISPVLGFLHPAKGIQISIFFFVLNLLVDISSALPPAFFCGTLLVAVLKDTALVYSAWSTLLYLLLKFSLWNFKNLPGIETTLNAVLDPFLSCCILIAITWLLIRIRPGVRRRIMEITLSCSLIIIIVFWLLKTIASPITISSGIIFVFFILVIAVVINTLINLRQGGTEE